MSDFAGTDPPEFPISWRHIGEVTLDEAGDLAFPAVSAVPGIYRFMIGDGTRVTAGYVGQAAVSLKSRFGLYRSRGRRPSYPLDKKTTSRNARLLISALLNGNTVNVDLVDEHVAGPDGREAVLDLADKIIRANLEKRLIEELSRTGIHLLNRAGNPRREIGSW